MFDRAIACRGRGELDQALALFETLCRFHPRVDEVQAGRGEALLALGRWAETTAALDVALTERPAMGEWITLRGTALQKQDRFRDALVKHERALALAPSRGPEISPGLALALGPRRLSLVPDPAFVPPDAAR